MRWPYCADAKACLHICCSHSIKSDASSAVWWNNFIAKGNIYASLETEVINMSSAIWESQIKKKHSVDSRFCYFLYHRAQTPITLSMTQIKYGVDIAVSNVF